MRRGDPNYWQWRKKTGRPKILKTPQQLWEIACDYFEWCDENPLFRQDFLRSGDFAGSKVDVKLGRPYTWQGLENHLREAGLVAKLDDYRANRGGNYSEFSDILSHIETIIYDQKYTGAVVGLFNANLIAKDLGMTEKIEQKITTEQPLFPDVD